MANIATIHERIALLVKEKAGNKNTVFAQALGVSEANIRGYAKTVVPKADVLSKIVRTYDDIDAYWLLTGEGSMLKSTTPKTDVVPPSPSESSPKAKKSEKTSSTEDTAAFLTYMDKKDQLIKEKDAIIEQKNQQIIDLKCQVTRLEGENRHLAEELNRIKTERKQQPSTDTPRSHTA